MLICLLIQTFLLILLIQVVFFVAAFLLKTDKFTDFAYGTSFIFAAIFTLLRAHIMEDIPFEKEIMLMMVTLWGLRLAIYLFGRILKIKEDYKYPIYNLLHLHSRSPIPIYHSNTEYLPLDEP